MKKSRYSDHQIINMLADQTAKDICHDYGISSATFYSWKANYAALHQA